MYNFKKLFLIILNIHLIGVCFGNNNFDYLKEIESEKSVIPKQKIYYLGKTYCANLPKELSLKGFYKLFIKYYENAEITEEFLSTYQDTCKSFAQNNVIPNTANDICIIGDIHGCFKSLMKIIEDLIAKKYLDKNLNILKDNFYMFFTGDLVDRIFFGAEVWATYLILKINNPNKIFLCRGNHETAQQNLYSDCNFYDELTKKYNNADGLKLLNLFFIIYETLPLGIYVKIGDNTILFAHGGFDPEYKSEKFITSDSKIELISDKKTIASFLWTDFSYLKILNEAYMWIRDWSLPRLFFNIPEFFEKRGFRAIFRGHQHHNHGLKVPHKESLDDWKKVFPDQSEIKFSDPKLVPIFTFSTVADDSAVWGKIVNNPFYAILRTSENFEDWKLIPCELPALPNEYDSDDSSCEDGVYTDEEIDKFNNKINERFNNLAQEYRETLEDLKKYRNSCKPKSKEFKELQYMIDDTEEVFKRLNLEIKAK